MTTRYDQEAYADPSAYNNEGDGYFKVSEKNQILVTANTIASDGPALFDEDELGSSKNFFMSDDAFVDRGVSDLADSVMRRHFDYEQELNLTDVSQREFEGSAVTFVPEDYFTPQDPQPSVLFTDEDVRGAADQQVRDMLFKAKRDPYFWAQWKKLKERVGEAGLKRKIAQMFDVDNAKRARLQGLNFEDRKLKEQEILREFGGGSGRRREAREDMQHNELVNAINQVNMSSEEKKRAEAEAKDTLTDLRSELSLAQREIKNLQSAAESKAKEEVDPPSQSSEISGFSNSSSENSPSSSGSSTPAPSPVSTQPPTPEVKPLPSPQPEEKITPLPTPQPEKKTTPTSSPQSEKKKSVDGPAPRSPTTPAPVPLSPSSLENFLAKYASIREGIVREDIGYDSNNLQNHKFESFVKNIYESKSLANNVKSWFTKDAAPSLVKDSGRLFKKLLMIDDSQSELVKGVEGLIATYNSSQEGQIAKKSLVEKWIEPESKKIAANVMTKLKSKEVVTPLGQKTTKPNELVTPLGQKTTKHLIRT